MFCNKGQDSYICVDFVEEGPCLSFKFHSSRCVLNSLLSIFLFREVCFEGSKCFTLNKAFLYSRWVARREERALECFCWFEVGSGSFVATAVPCVCK